MITKESKNDKKCLFCASDYHLEMILLPYINKKLYNTKFIIFTENNLEDSLKKLLTKINLNEDNKSRIKELNWRNEDKLLDLQKAVESDENITIIVNGDFNYIENMHKKIKKIKNKQLCIIDCFHISDPQIERQNIELEYSNIINTERM